MRTCCMRLGAVTEPRTTDSGPSPKFGFAVLLVCVKACYIKDSCAVLIGWTLRGKSLDLGLR